MLKAEIYKCGYCINMCMCPFKLLSRILFNINLWPWGKNVYNTFETMEVYLHVVRDYSIDVTIE